jgi:hypothetical protein
MHLRIHDTERHDCHTLHAFSMALVLGACSQTFVQGSTSTTGATVQPHAAHALLVDTAACWLGGIWGDVQAETPTEREQASQRRCDVVITSVFGKSDRTRWLQLRAFDPETVGAVRSALERTALHDPADAPHARELVGVFNALAAAEEETTHARRATHRVLRDLDHEREKLDAEETAALPQLEAFAGFASLYRMDAGDLRAERHALALFVLLDRMRIAQELPVHLKPYVVALPLKEVFSAPMPDLPYDASKPLGHGAWLRYLENTAIQAQHGIPDWTRPPQVRHEQAVAGILAGIADQLRADESTLVTTDPPLARVVDLTIRALEQSRERAGL